LGHEPSLDHAGLAAIALTPVAAEESQGPGPLTARMNEFVAGSAERNGPGAAAALAIALARQHFVTLDALAAARNTSAAQLLDALEVEQMERLDDEP
jgi:hypothetical protein